jgi:two-component system phosphate regulon sensor histidine kinase PhoR
MTAAFQMISGLSLRQECPRIAPEKGLMKRFTLNLNLTSVIVTIAVGVLLPVILSTAVGIVALVFADDARSILIGVLVLSFTLTAAGSGLVAVVLTGRKARLARLQADFVANIAHEIRTPLSAIRLYTQTLQSGKLAEDPERAAECLATILRETEWMDAMLDRALTWRASSRSVLRLNMRSAPISNAVNDAITRFRSMAAPGEVSVSASINTSLNVKHDPTALHAVVLNLLTNAYKYTGEDKQISVTVRDVDEQVVIDVSDNGIGLSPTEAKRIFNPFYRVRQAGHGAASGVGLGLTIVRYLVGRHRGSIRAENRPEGGSMFTITLPADRTP